jgi:Tfp pilus assembly protein PilN
MLTSETKAPERPPLLPIVARLLPPEIEQARHSRKVRRSVISGVAVFAALLVAWYCTVAYETSKAQHRLAAAQTDLQKLQRQQSSFAELIGTQAAAKTIGTQLAALLADDLQWSRLFSSLQAAAPPGVEVTGVSGALSSKPKGGGNPAPAPGPGAPGAPGGRAAQPIGTLTVSGTGPSKPVVATYVDALATVPGLANPLLSDVTTQTGGVQFSVRLDITTAALGGRYTSPSPTPSGSKKR